jgi:acetyltransferase-like isoleucine patch superfamily enzyme
MIPYSENIKITKKGIRFTDKNGNTLNAYSAVNKAIYRIFNYWLDLKLFVIHLVSLHVPFHSVRKLVFLAAGVKMGKGTTVHMGCKFFEPKGVVIGEDTKIGNNAFLDGRTRLFIGDHVDLASEVLVYNSEHDLESSDFSAILEEVSIGDYSFIGPRAIILPGVTIGKGAIVAAGAVVTKSVPDFKIVAGIPAKIIGERKNNKLNYRLGRARLFQ